MTQFFQQIFIKIVSIIAGLIITLGIIQMPSDEYQKQPSLTTKEISQIHLSDQKATTDKATTTPPKEIPKKEGKKISAPEAAIPETQQPETPTLPAISLTKLNEEVRKTIVNIICENRAGGSLNPITGSGVIVSSKGIILTNAHIGQYFLLEGIPETGYLNCVIRNGDIAQPAYDAKLIYIPSVWIEKNAENIIQQKPQGTGENDYAFLLITESALLNKELPSSFDFTEPNFDFNILPINFSVFLAGYPAGFLGGAEIQKNLGLLSTFANIIDLYTFATASPTTLDLISLSGNIASQSGSSGGAVVDTRNGKLLGIITTSSEATTTSGRILNAITLPHIKRSFEKYTGESLPYFLDTPEDYDVLSRAEFNRLKEILIKQLNKNS